MRIRKGQVTVVAFNRIQVSNRNATKRFDPIKLRNPQDLRVTSVITHRGSINSGHYVSYHEVGGNWFMNDDNKRILQVSNPLAPSTKFSPSEVIEIFFIQNL